MLRAAIYVWQATYTHTRICMDGHSYIRTRMGRCTRLPIRVRALIRIWANLGYPAIPVWAAHTRMGKILVWDGTDRIFREIRAPQEKLSESSDYMDNF